MKSMQILNFQLMDICYWKAPLDVSDLLPVWIQQRMFCSVLQNGGMQYLAISRTVSTLFPENESPEVCFLESGGTGETATIQMKAA